MRGCYVLEEPLSYSRRFQSRDYWSSGLRAIMRAEVNKKSEIFGFLNAFILILVQPFSCVILCKLLKFSKFNLFTHRMGTIAISSSWTWVALATLQGIHYLVTIEMLGYGGLQRLSQFPKFTKIPCIQNQALAISALTCSFHHTLPVLLPARLWLNKVNYEMLQTCDVCRRCHGGDYGDDGFAVGWEWGRGCSNHCKWSCRDVT